MFREKTVSVNRLLKGALFVGNTYHIFILIPIQSWNPSVRVTVQDSEFHGAAKASRNWGKEKHAISVGSARVSRDNSERITCTCHGLLSNPGNTKVDFQTRQSVGQNIK